MNFVADFFEKIDSHCFISPFRREEGIVVLKRIYLFNNSRSHYVYLVRVRGLSTAKFLETLNKKDYMLGERNNIEELSDSHVEALPEDFHIVAREDDATIFFPAVGMAIHEIRGLKGLPVEDRDYLFIIKRRGHKFTPVYEHAKRHGAMPY